MSLVRCKCGVYTSYGLFCVSCQKDVSIDIVYHTPEDIDEYEMEEYGFTVVTDLEEYESDYDEDD